jgi:hypothetical protein
VTSSIFTSIECVTSYDDVIVLRVVTLGVSQDEMDGYTLTEDEEKKRGAGPADMMGPEVERLVPAEVAAATTPDKAQPPSSLATTPTTGGEGGGVGVVDGEGEKGGLMTPKSEGGGDVGKSEGLDEVDKSIKAKTP